MELQKALAAADENYLIGLSNKGTVNRAKKDLAAMAPPEVRGNTVIMGNVTCQIRVPLGESRCSCPSTAMCRHRIAAILWLKEHGGAEAEPERPAFEELKNYPAEKLTRQLGAKRLSALLLRHKSGVGPEFHETTVITAELPWHPATVRLLEPLEHSTCSCRSKALCLHKAEALLHWQLSKGIADPDALQAVHKEENQIDLEAIQGVCQAVCQTLASQLATGLSRMPQSVCDTVERMAALCHTAGLPELERALRSLHGEYAAYFARSATFRDTALLARLSRAYRLASAMEQGDRDTVRRLAGSFREEYEPIGDLKLYLLGLREFAGRGGYAGTIYYFWEREAHRFYTFTHVLPTFYEGSPKRRSRDTVPWGLPCTLRQAWNCALDLTGVKATRGGNLSSTEGCRAALIGHRHPLEAFPPEKVVTDFGALFCDRSRPGAPELQRLAVIRPRRVEPQPFDRVGQRFTMRLLDDMGRDLWLEVRYSSVEAQVVEQLETLVRRLENGASPNIVFFGSVYRDEDKLKLYPIEYFTQWGDRDDRTAQ